MSVSRPGRASSGDASSQRPVSLVTGAGSGIGRAIAHRLAAEGHFVWSADVDAEAARRTTDALVAAGGAGDLVEMDVAEEESVRLACRRILQDGPVDALVTAAGIAGPGTATSTSDREWQRVLDVNLTGAWRCVREVLPGMAAAGRGAIVTTSSITGLRGFPGAAAYSASKAGLIGLARQLAAEHAASGIRVNSVAPGTVSTPLVHEMWASGSGFGVGATLADREEAAAASYPVGRIGRPADVAAAVAFLVSEDASWITGAVLVVDGGKTSLV